MDSMFIRDIKEKEIKAPQVPTFPQNKASTSGFPEHKKRTRVSAFKQQRQGAAQKPESKPSVFTTSSNVPLSAIDSKVSRDASSAQVAGQANMTEERRRIDQENSDRLASMSTQEIEEARQQLFTGLDNKVLEMLLKRATLDEKNGPSLFDQPSSSRTNGDAPQQMQSTPMIVVEDTSAKIAPKITPEPDTKPEATTEKSSTTTNGKQANPETATDDQPASSIDDAAPSQPLPKYIINNEDRPKDPTHFPAPPLQPDMDPSDPDWLANLHKKYFPNLPADPTKLAWMAPIPTPNSPADQESPYYPNQSSIPISQLRFDFRGTLLPPRIARAIPVTKGLHHHGEAPEAAGYTVAELARLCRSAVPGQRCIAYQTLGRILFRLGRGEFGKDEIADGIWASMVEGRVMTSLYEESGIDPDAPASLKGDGKGRGHRSAYAFAVEAIWLFEKGGWRERLRRGK